MTDPTGAPGPGLTGKLVVAWLIVGVPLVWGVWQVVHKSLALFR
jgi:hypothetical protein